jgi:hypothetical protein
VVFQPSTELSQADEAKVLTAFMQAFLDQSKKFTAVQYYAGNLTDTSGNYKDANYVPVPHPYDPGAGAYSDRVMTVILSARERGVPNTLLNQICDWGKSVWPKGNWDALKG